VFLSVLTQSSLPNNQIWIYKIQFLTRLDPFPITNNIVQASQNNLFHLFLFNQTSFRQNAIFFDKKLVETQQWFFTG
jgi:hypothetical protein